MSSLGRILLGFSIFGAVYSVAYLVWIMKNREVCILYRPKLYIPVLMKQVLHWRSLLIGSGVP